MVQPWLRIGLSVIWSLWGNLGGEATGAGPGTQVAAVAWLPAQVVQAQPDGTPQPLEWSMQADQLDPATYPPLEPGNSGPAVFRLQTWLQQAGYLPTTVDGLYGDGTARAVAAFQADQGMVADGRVGTQTWQVLRVVVNPATALADSPLETMPPLTLTPLTFSHPAPPPSPLWLVLMPLIPLLGGGATYLQHRWQDQRRSGEATKSTDPKQ